jgi:hypothetical protein
MVWVNAVNKKHLKYGGNPGERIGAKRCYQWCVSRLLCQLSAITGRTPWNPGIIAIYKKRFNHR